MPNTRRILGNVAQGGLSGAAMGASIGAIGGPLGALIGGGIGLLEALFGGGEDPEEKINKYINKLNEMRQKTLNEGLQKLYQGVGAETASATAGARRRAIASGRDTEAESYILPAVGQVQTAGHKAAEQYTFDVNRMYDQAVIEAEQGRLAIPEEPGITDYMMTAAPYALQYKQGQDILEAMGKWQPTGFNIQDMYSTVGDIKKTLGNQFNASYGFVGGATPDSIMGEPVKMWQPGDKFGLGGGKLSSLYNRPAWR